MVKSFLALLASPLEGWNFFFYMNNVSMQGQKKFFRGGKWKIFGKLFRTTSKLSGNIFWDLWDHLVAQKDDFWKKISQKVFMSRPPSPLVRQLRDILKFEKSHFLAVRVILGDFSPQNCNSITVRTWRKSCVNLDVINFFQQKIKNFLEKPLSYPEIVLWSPGTIWSLRKTILRKKSRKKSRTWGPPPLVTFWRDIYMRCLGELTTNFDIS